MSDAEMQAYMSRTDNVPDGLRGFRIYEVKPINPGFRGGDDFYMVREEVIHCTEGRVRFSVEDLARNTAEYVLEEGSGLHIPRFILHSYEALRKRSRLHVMANTDFDPADERTHDSYDRGLFVDLQDSFH